MFIQIYIAKHMCNLTFANVKADQEYYALKIGNFFKKLPRSLYILEDSPPKMVQHVRDRALREELSKRYTEIIDRVKYDVTYILTRAAEVIKDDCQRLLDTETQEIWQKQRQLPAKERLSTILLTLIEDRQKNIVESVRRICHLKMDFFLEIPLSVLKLSAST